MTGPTYTPCPIKYREGPGRRKHDLTHPVERDLTPACVRSTLASSSHTRRQLALAELLYLCVSGRFSASASGRVIERRFFSARRWPDTQVMLEPSIWSCQPVDGDLGILTGRVDQHSDLRPVRYPHLLFFFYLVKHFVLASNLLTTKYRTCVHVCQHFSKHFTRVTC
jgi:hypothetical protein